MRWAVVVGAILIVAGSAGAETCIVCGNPDVPESAPHVTYREQQWPVCVPDCAEVWMDARESGGLDRIVKRMEPRGALFQGDSRFLNITDEFGAFTVGFPLLTVGLWVLVVVASGSVAAALAVAAHRPVGMAFMVGAALPVIGVWLSRRLSRGTGLLEVRGNKVPTTRAPATCPACGAPCHPSASRCARCGKAVVPTADSEVERSA